MTPDEIEALVEVVVRRELRKIFAPLFDSEPVDEWADAKTTAKQLGFPNSEALYEAIKAGLLRVGDEVRDRRLPGRKKPRYQFHITKCQKRLNQAPEKRRSASGG